MIVLDQVIVEQGVQERGIGERENSGASDREVVEIKNTVRNERE